MLYWKCSSLACPGLVKGCGAFGEKQRCLEDHLLPFHVNAGPQVTQSDVHFERALLKHFVPVQPVVEAKVRVRAVDAGGCPLKRDERPTGPHAEHLARGNVLEHDAAPRPAAYVVRPLNERGTFL